MNHNFCESDLEQATLEWFEEIGYTVSSGPTLAPDGEYPERKSYGDVLLEMRVKTALSQLNKGLPQEALDEAYRQISVPQSPSLIVNNMFFQKIITDGIDVSYRLADGNIKYTKALLFDFEHFDRNDFLIVNQFTVKENKYDKRPDAIVFVNGIPLIIIELKSASSENVDISDAYNQLQTYKATIPSAFTYNAFMVISDGINAKAGTITSNEERFMTWRTIDGDGVAPRSIPQLEVLIKGMFDKKRLLDLIKNFIVFQSDGADTYKLLAGYHQYHAVNKAVSCTERATRQSGDKKIGVIWHTQGSGKSLSMVFYAGKLVINEQLGNPTIVVITDRNDLDDQLFSTFAKSNNILRGTPLQAKDREDLRTLLNNRQSGGIIFTTIQKFTPNDKGNDAPLLTDRNNVIVMADEAHRSQYGFGADVVKNNESADIKFGYAKYMRDSLPNASYIGFTGTPIDFIDKNTTAIFGEYIDVYDMTRAVEDDTTVKIFYESRIAKLNLPEELKPIVDTQYDEITEYQEDIQREQLKSKWSRLEAIVGAKERIKAIAMDIVEHFEKRQSAQEILGGKGFIISMSRRIAIDLYNEIIKLRPNWHNDDLMRGTIKVVMTGASSDPIEWQKHIGTKATREILAKRIKDVNDELQLVIVRDMWLTGFDVPSMHTMYIDKPMQGHNLMQAIARVNRVFKEKQGGVVVDYIGIADNLKEALSKYTENDRKTTGIDTAIAVEIMLEKLHLIHDLLHKHDFSKFLSGNSKEKMQCIIETMDYIIELREEGKKEYLQLVSDLSKAYSLCATSDEANVANVEIGFHKAIKTSLMKMLDDTERKKTTSQLDFELNQLISRSLSSDGMLDILSEVGLNKPNIAILSKEFLEEIKDMKQQNLAVELLEKLLKGNIKSFARKNLVQSKKFSDLLAQTLNKYQNRTIETTQVVLQLVQLAEDIKESVKRGLATGLSEDELAFYDALTENDSAKKFMEDEILKKIAKELTIAIRKDITVDWSIRDNVQAKMKMTIKRLLKKHGYPPDKTEKATETILEQTKLMCQNEIL